jgi:hypothetical protein
VVVFKLVSHTCCLFIVEPHAMPTFSLLLLLLLLLDLLFITVCRVCSYLFYVAAATISDSP